jgi:hypothetical protein
LAILGQKTAVMNEIILKIAVKKELSKENLANAKFGLQL